MQELLQGLARDDDLVSRWQAADKKILDLEIRSTLWMSGRGNWANFRIPRYRGISRRSYFSSLIWALHSDRLERPTENMANDWVGDAIENSG